MAVISAARVAELATTTGTGAFTLAGALTGFRAFSAVCATNDTLEYTIEAIDGSGAPTGAWETGTGTYSGANTLTRTTVAASSNAGAAVNFAAGTKRVFITGSAATSDALNRSAVFSGRYYAPDTLDFQSGGTQTVVADELFLLPFSSKVSFDRMAVHFTAVGAGTSSYRLGVYNSSTTTGLPTTLVHDSGAIVAATTGLKNYAIGSTITPTAPLWLAFIQNANLELVTGAVSSQAISKIIGNTSLNAAAPGNTGVSYVMTFGALPADLTGLTATRVLLAMITAAKI